MSTFNPSDSEYLALNKPLDQIIQEERELKDSTRKRQTIKISTQSKHMVQQQLNAVPLKSKKRKQSTEDDSTLLAPKQRPPSILIHPKPSKSSPKLQRAESPKVIVSVQPTTNAIPISSSNRVINKTIHIQRADSSSKMTPHRHVLGGKKTTSIPKNTLENIKILVQSASNSNASNPQKNNIVNQKGMFNTRVISPSSEIGTRKHVIQRVQSSSIQESGISRKKSNSRPSGNHDEYKKSIIQAGEQMTMNERFSLSRKSKSHL